LSGLVAGLGLIIPLTHQNTMIDGCLKLVVFIVCAYFLIKVGLAVLIALSGV